MHFTLLEYSKNAAEWLLENNYHLLGKSDTRFLDTVFMILRNQFNYKIPFTVAQFLSPGYSQRKMMLVADLIQHVKTKHQDLTKAKAPKKKSRFDSKYK